MISMSAILALNIMRRDWCRSDVVSASGVLVSDHLLQRSRHECYQLLLPHKSSPHGVSGGTHRMVHPHAVREGVLPYIMKYVGRVCCHIS